MTQKIIPKDKVIDNTRLVELIEECFFEMGGIRHVGDNLNALGFSKFVNETRHIPKIAGTRDLGNLISNELLVICLTIFTTVKDVEGEILINTPFQEGINILRGI